MAQRITVNTTKGSLGTGTIVISSDATGYVNLNGGTNPANSAGETITGMNVKEIIWSQSNTANWSVARGGNVVFTCYGTFGHANFHDSQFKLENPAGGDEQANVVFTLSGGNGNILIKLTKRSGE